MAYPCSHSRANHTSRDPLPDHAPDPLQAAPPSSPSASQGVVGSELTQHAEHVRGSLLGGNMTKYDGTAKKKNYNIQVEGLHQRGDTQVGKV